MKTFHINGSNRRSLLIIKYFSSALKKDVLLPHQILQIKTTVENIMLDRQVINTSNLAGDFKQRYYDVIHDDINFYYQRKGNKYSEWIKQNLYLHLNLFWKIKCLDQFSCEDTAKATFQRLYLSMVRYREYEDKIVVNFKLRQ